MPDIRETNSEERRSEYGHPGGYAGRIREALLRVGLKQINWQGFPPDQLCEAVEIMGGNPSQRTRRKLESEARRAFLRFRRAHNSHRLAPYTSLPVALQVSLLDFSPAPAYPLGE